jgi:TfoX/Sxy family transcriptional regulator of competence genes
MFSFLDVDGTMALRPSDQLRDEFLARYESGPVVQYGRVMRGYLSMPEDPFKKTDELREWFDKSYNWKGTLEPKPTKK